METYNQSSLRQSSKKSSRRLLKYGFIGMGLGIVCNLVWVFGHIIFRDTAIDGFLQLVNRPFIYIFGHLIEASGFIDEDAIIQALIAFGVCYAIGGFLCGMAILPLVRAVKSNSSG